ncbi:hypothetical protein N6L27_00090 [Leisingera sp. SS27]|uniref:hypothetical protein n=1 Tax=Leisingera sp. SS27 TaxID=2979462 RepID=UPI00232ACCC3|nr:hypothetical protein [Leisingera sp. SS27]MDC0656392.1 hypothetical protein [Leisingera sp. SS27]
MDDRALISEISRILDTHGLEHGKRDAALGVLWIVLHPNSTPTSKKNICDDGSILNSQRWTLFNNQRETEMKVELHYNTDIK